jgi:hypothetical protein
MTTKKKDTEKKVLGSINVDVAEMGEKYLCLHMHLGDGSLGKTKFSASLALPDYSFMVEVNKKTYLVRSQDIISAVVDKVTSTK